MLEHAFSDAEYMSLFKLAKGTALRSNYVTTSDAEDIAQNVLIGLWRRQRYCPDREIVSKEAWVCAATRYAASRWLQKRHARSSRELTWALNQVAHESGEIDFELDISALPSPYFELFQMRFVEEMTIKEIGCKMGVSPGTVKRLFARLRSLLIETVFWD